MKDNFRNALLCARFLGPKKKAGKLRHETLDISVWLVCLCLAWEYKPSKVILYAFNTSHVTTFESIFPLKPSVMCLTYFKKAFKVILINKSINHFLEEKFCYSEMVI